MGTVGKVGAEGTASTVGAKGTVSRYLAAEESRDAAPLWTLVLVATNILPEKMFFISQLIAKRRDVSNKD